MEPVPTGRVTELLRAWGRGSREALDELVPLVYAELRRLAGRQLGRERRDHTLEPAALAHEVFLRLSGYRQVGWQDRAHFFAIAVRVMRRILVEHARRRRARKRGGSAVRVSGVELRAPSRSFDLEALDEALARLESFDPVQGRIVELRYFGGLSIEETAEALGVSPATVKRDWAVARLWLRRELDRSGPP
jgi:RNA polymerase sigma factor (TIGR02999 family)